MINECKDAAYIQEYNDEDEDGCNMEMPENPLEFIGLTLHCMQQGQANDLRIHGRSVRAILMDQTCGYVNEEDIFWTDHPERPYQRLKNILNNNYEI
jgi:hypothetical protein